MYCISLATILCSFTGGGDVLFLFLVEHVSVPRCVSDGSTLQLR